MWSPVLFLSITLYFNFLLYIFSKSIIASKTEMLFSRPPPRLKISPISGNRRRKLKKINISNSGNYKQILENVKDLYPSIVNVEVEKALSVKHEIYYFNDVVFSILNWYDDIPYIPVLLGGRLDRSGITPNVHYYFLDKLVGHNYPYLYISEWYEQFHYKSELPGFEWWNGENWVTK